MADHQSLSSDSDFVFLLIIRQEFKISKRSLAAYLSFFSDSLFLSGAGILEPCAKGDDRLMNCRYIRYRNVQLHIYSTIRLGINYKSTQ